MLDIGNELKVPHPSLGMPVATRSGPVVPRFIAKAEAGPPAASSPGLGMRAGRSMSGWLEGYQRI
jgi:hypothetical protein